MFASSWRLKAPNIDNLDGKISNTALDSIFAA
jgi:hypothetical protein